MEIKWLILKMACNLFLDTLELRILKPERLVDR